MASIHPTAVVAPGAQIHPSCEIGPYAVIGPGVRLGPGNVVGPHAVLDGETEIGADNRFLASCSIGASPQITGRAGDVGRVRDLYREVAERWPESPWGPRALAESSARRRPRAG